MLLGGFAIVPASLPSPIPGVISCFPTIFTFVCYPNISLPSIPGLDVAGIVETVGSDVTTFREGDAVYGMVRFPGGGKGYAEYTTAPVTDLAHKPASINHLQAAAVPMAALTAWQFLYLDLERGQTVLVNGAAGGVGHFAVQLAKLKGAHVIGAASGRH